VCGIAGAFIYDQETARLDRLVAAVEASSARGIDSFGVVRWSPSSGFRTDRRIGQARSGWLDGIGRPQPGEPTVYLHTSRAEPTTEWQRDKTDNDIPPFIVDSVAVAHNGIVSNDDELLSAFGIDRVSSIDTAVIPALVARIGVWETLANLKGGAALAIFDSGSAQLVLCRNFMPLVVAWEPGIVCFASEAGFFPGAADPFRPFQIWELPPHSGIELSTQGFRGPVPWEGHMAPPSATSWRPYPSLDWSRS